MHDHPRNERDERFVTIIIIASDDFTIYVWHTHSSPQVDYRQASQRPIIPTYNRCIIVIGSSRAVYSTESYIILLFIVRTKSLERTASDAFIKKHNMMTTDEIYSSSSAATLKSKEFGCLIRVKITPSPRILLEKF